jgi:nucleotide-binding universal stress UspA family protein
VGSVPVADVVPGDVVLLAEGDRVPADARSLSGELELDVSALTGESAPVERLADVVDNAARTLDSPVLIFSGTGCVGGSAEAVVHATGAHTEIGRIAALAGRPGHCMRTPSRTNRSAAVRTTSAPGPVGRQPTNPHRTVGAPSTGQQRLGRKPTIDGGSFAAPHGPLVPGRMTSCAEGLKTNRSTTKEPVMTTYESHRATVEARKVVATTTAPVSRHETAMSHYLTANAHLSEHARNVRQAAEATTESVAPESMAIEVSAQRRDLVVAGIDGSRCARDAARWAAAEAIRRHGALRLIHAYSLPPAGYPGYNPYPAALLTQLREEGEALLADTAAALGHDHPTLDITTGQIHGDTPTVLQRASKDAVLTVVGAHGKHRISLGTVATAIAAKNPVPVAVIRPGDAHTNGPVIVGIDGSPASEYAIAFAFDAAALRGAPLIAVHAWTDRTLDGPVPAHSAVTVEPQPIAESEGALLADQLAGWAGKYPDVPVQQVVAHDRPAPALLKYAGTAQLIVVGTRGNGTLAGMFLGSTSHALINRAECPVVVARPHRAG